MRTDAWLTKEQNSIRAFRSACVLETLAKSKVLVAYNEKTSIAMHPEGLMHFGFADRNDTLVKRLSEDSVKGGLALWPPPLAVEIEPAAVFGAGIGSTPFLRNRLEYGRGMSG